MSDGGRSKLTRWLGSALTVLMLVTMLFCYLWFQVAVEVIRANDDTFVTNAVTTEVFAAPLVAFMISLPLTLLWHLGDMLEPSRKANFYIRVLLKQRCLLLSVVVLFSEIGYFEADFMRNLACDHCGHHTTMLEKSIGLVSLLLCPILCLGKVVLSINSRMRLPTLI